jgi:hypothetical protein
MRVMDCPSRAGDFPVPEKRMAGQFVRPNFDKTPNWLALTQRRTGGDHAPAMTGMPVLFAAVWLFRNERAETRRIV